jgi:hypothetical protein
LGKAIGGLLIGEYLAVHTDDLADGPQLTGAAPTTPKPHHVTGLPTDRAARIDLESAPMPERAIDL